MTYYILCNTFKQAVMGAKAFANHYSENSDIKVVKRRTEVIVGDNKFVFINNNDPRSTKGRRGEFIQFDDFAKKYFKKKGE